MRQSPREGDDPAASRPDHRPGRDGRRRDGQVRAGGGWLRGYRGRWLRGDLAAGVTTAAVVIPQAMADATIAGLPVQVGLYVATVPTLVYALAGTSYFANGPRLRGRLLGLVDAVDPPPRVLVLDLSAVPDIDVTALDVLAAFDADLRRRGIALWLAHLNERPLDMLRRLPDPDSWERRLFHEVDDAVTAFAATPPTT